MFARFDENPAMTLEDIKETKRYGRTDARAHGQRENSIPTTNKVCGEYNEGARVVIKRSPIVCLCRFFMMLKGSKINSLWLVLLKVQTHLSFYGCPCYLKE